MTEQEKAAQAQAADFELMNREDEQQILDDLRGIPTERFVYKNSRGQFELSYAGTKWAVREMAEKGEAIRIQDHPRVERCVIDPEYVTVTVLASRVQVNRDAKVETLLDTQVGSARGWIKLKRLDGTVVPDEFFYNKTISKAVRNVQQALMPQDFKKAMIDVLVKKLGQPAGQAAQPQQQKKKAPDAAPAGAQQKAAPAQAPATDKKDSAQQKAAPPAAAPAKTGKVEDPKKAAPAAQSNSPAEVKNTTKSQPGQKPSEAAHDVLCQRFSVVLKQASGAGQDHAKAVAFLKALTGKDAVNKLSSQEIQELGPVLAGVTRGVNRVESGVVYDTVTGEQLYPKPEPQAEPPAESQPEPATDPVSDGPPPPEDPMF